MNDIQGIMDTVRTRNMATVLVTGVGGATGIGAVQSLHRETHHDVVGVDMDRNAAGLYLADAGRTIPPATDDEWATALAKIVSEYSIDVVIPTVDEELAELSTLSSALPKDVSVVAPRQAVIDRTLDKYETYRTLQANDHPVPRTWLATEAESVDLTQFPLVVKPRRGRGSRGLSIVEHHQELSDHLTATDYSRNQLLVQQYIPGTEYTTSVVVTGDNSLLGVVPKEAIEKQGITVRGVTRRNTTITQSCRDIFETLDPAGPLNVQQIIDEDGIPQTIEINPRFSSTSCLTVAAGVDEFDLLVRDALGESVSPVDGYSTDLYILRYDNHIYVEEGELRDGGTT